MQVNKSRARPKPGGLSKKETASANGTFPNKATENDSLPKIADSDSMSNVDILTTPDPPRSENNGKNCAIHLKMLRRESRVLLAFWLKEGLMPPLEIK